jgi:hypothetical protein
MTLITGDRQDDVDVVQETGNYVNPATGHRAHLVEGFELPGGYVREPDGEDRVSDEDAWLERAITAEKEATREAREEAAQAKAAAEQAENARLEAEKAASEKLDQVERERAEAADAAAKRIAELEAELEEAKKTAESSPAGDGDAKPAARGRRTGS